VLYLNNPYGRGVRQSFVARFTALGGVILESDPYIGDTPDVGIFLDRIRANGKSEFLVVAGIAPKRWPCWSRRVSAA
jgi:hypothetical protein